MSRKNNKRNHMEKRHTILKCQFFSEALEYSKSVLSCERCHGTLSPTTIASIPTAVVFYNVGDPDGSGKNQESCASRGNSRDLFTTIVAAMRDTQGTQNACCLNTQTNAFPMNFKLYFSFHGAAGK